MKLFIKIFAGFIILSVLVVGGFVIYMTRGLEAGEVLAVQSVKVSELDDGVYMGKYSEGRWGNEVNVTVKDGKIVKIDVVKSVTFENPEVTKELFGKVIEKQDTDIDAISGSTVTCKAYLKSIENAVAK